MISQAQLNYQRIEKAIIYLDLHLQQQPDLDELAEAVGLSAYYLQRLFQDWAGLSPKRFLQSLAAAELKARFMDFPNLDEAAEAVGLAGANRVYDLFVQLEAMNPQVFKEKGRGIRISYGLHATPFGTVLLAATNRGITDLHFVDEPTTQERLDWLRLRWANAELVENPAETGPLAEQIFRLKDTGSGRLQLLVAGTNFQLKVWEALLTIPEGQLATYQAIAKSIGQPKANQAVGSAVGANPVGYLIPCHRVIRSTGIIGEYRWGGTRKKALLAWESGRSQSYED